MSDHLSPRAERWQRGWFLNTMDRRSLIKCDPLPSQSQPTSQPPPDLPQQHLPKLRPFPPHPALRPPLLLAPAPELCFFDGDVDRLDRSCLLGVSECAPVFLVWECGGGRGGGGVGVAVGGLGFEDVVVEEEEEVAGHES